MNNKLAKIVLLSLTAFANICLGDDNTVLYDRLERMERDMISLQKQFYRGEPAAPGGSKNFSSSKSSSESGTPQLSNRITELEEQIRHLNGKIEEVGHSVSKLNKDFEKLSSDIDFRLREMEKPSGAAKAQIDDQVEAEQPVTHNKPKTLGTIKVTNVGEAEPGSPDTPTSSATEEPKDEIKEEYEKAFALHKAGKTNEAQKAFKDFILNHADHKLSGNAFFWLGESYAGQKDSEKAAINYLKSYKKFPKGPKAPDSLIKLAATLAKLDKTGEACKTLDKFAKEFPNANKNLKAKMEEEQKRLSCKR